MFSIEKIKCFLAVLLTVLLTASAQEHHIQGFSLNESEVSIPRTAILAGDMLPFKLSVEAINSLIHLRYTMYGIQSAPFKIDNLMSQIDTRIRKQSNRQSSYYISSTDELSDCIEPYTLYNLLYHRSHAKITIAEGTKFKFRVYSLLDQNITNIASRGVNIWWDENGKYHECMIPPTRLTNLEKPTEQQWKDLRMRLMFIFLMDQKLGNISNQPFNSKRK